MNELKYYKFQHLFFIVITTILVFVIYFIPFYSYKQYSPFDSLLNTLDSNKTYCYNNDSAAKYYNGSPTDIAYYAYDYLKVDEEYKTVLYTNRAGIEQGIPYMDNLYLGFMPFKEFTIIDDVILTNNVSNETNSIKYVDYFDKYYLKNALIEIDLNIDYLCVTEDISTYDVFLSCYNNSFLDISKLMIYNDICIGSFITSGSYLKQSALKQYSTILIIMLIISIIPLLFLLICLGIFINSYLNNQSSIIILENIYYKKKKKIVKHYYFLLLTNILFSSLIGISLSFLITMNNNLIFLGIAYLIAFIIETIGLWVLVNKKINSLCKNNHWRIMYDFN